jgi:hypothetical protein
MQLPEASSTRLHAELVSKSLLETPAIDDLIKSLESEKSVLWNLILTQQFKIEQGGQHEAES